MITLHLNQYTDAEKKALDYELQSALNKMFVKYCGKSPCVECEYRHLCNDLVSARRSTNKVVGGNAK